MQNVMKHHDARGGAVSALRVVLDNDADADLGRFFEELSRYMPRERGGDVREIIVDVQETLQMLEVVPDLSDLERRAREMMHRLKAAGTEIAFVSV